MALPDATVSLYRLSPTPRQNLPNYTTQTDALGNYSINGITDGTYIVSAQKHGYTVSWKKVVITGDTIESVDVSTLLPDESAEGIYNEYGHVYKMYKYSKTSDATHWYVKALLFLGDLYNTGVCEYPLIGYLEAISADTTLELIQMDTPLGTQGFFDSTETLTQTSSTIINFDATISEREFDGFAFKLTSPSGIEATVRLAIGTSTVDIIVENPGSGGSGTGGVGFYGGGVPANANIGIYLADTNILVGSATSDSSGNYYIPGLTSGVYYDIHVSASHYGSSSGTFTAPEDGSNICHDCVMFPGLGFLFTTLFIFSPLSYQADKIYGKVYNRRKGLSYGIADSLVLSTDASTGDEYATLSESDGSYEMYVPVSTYDVFARKRSYHNPCLQRGDVSSDLEVNIPIMPINRATRYAKSTGRTIAV